MTPGSELTRAFEKAEFTLVRWAKHKIWRCPCGHRQLSSPATPGKGRAVSNTLGDISRTLRECKALKEKA